MFLISHIRSLTLHIILWGLQWALPVLITLFLQQFSHRSIYLYLTVILRGRAGYELIYITNEAVGLVGYYQLISGKSEKNNCLVNFQAIPLDFFPVKPPQIVTFSLPTTPRKHFSDLQNFSTGHQFFPIWSNLTIMAHIMGLGNQSESWKIIILS